MLLCLKCCLLYVICMTHHYSCKWFEPETGQVGCYSSICCIASCFTIYMPGHCSLRCIEPKTALNRLLFPCLVYCLLCAIHTTGHYSCHWLELEIVQMTVITLFAVLLFMSACVCCEWTYWSIVLSSLCSMGVMTKSAGFSACFYLKWSVLLFIIVRFLVLNLFQW